MKRKAGEELDSSLLNEAEKEFIYNPDRVGEKASQEYDYSALEMVVNIALHRRVIGEPQVKHFFTPQKITDWRSW